MLRFDSCLSLIRSNNETTNESTILKSKADQKPFTLKPSTKLEAIKIINAFITNKNKPNVNIVIGRVNKIKTGFTKTFNTASAKARIIAVVTLFTETPGNSLATSKIASVVVKMRIRKLIIDICCKGTKSYFSPNQITS